MEHAIFGNGKPGVIRDLQDIRSDFRSFTDVWKAREQDKMKFDDRQERMGVSRERKLNLTIAIATVLLLLVGTVVGVLTYENLTHHAILSIQRGIDEYATDSYTYVPEVTP